jgi:hypothetical protein
VLPADQPLDVLLAPLEPSERIAGTILIERTDDPEEPFVPFGAPLPVAYQGPATPRLKLLIPPLGRPGHYRATFRGEPGASDPVLFALTKHSAG